MSALADLRPALSQHAQDRAETSERHGTDACLAQDERQLSGLVLPGPWWYRERRAAQTQRERLVAERPGLKRRRRPMKEIAGHEDEADEVTSPRSRGRPLPTAASSSSGPPGKGPVVRSSQIEAVGPLADALDATERAILWTIDRSFARLRVAVSPSAFADIAGDRDRQRAVERLIDADLLLSGRRGLVPSRRGHRVAAQLCSRDEARGLLTASRMHDPSLGESLFSKRR